MICQKLFLQQENFYRKPIHLAMAIALIFVLLLRARNAKSLNYPTKKDALLNYVGGVQPEPPRHMETYVHAAISQIVEQTAADLVLAWTDADDETKGEKLRLNPDHPPVTIVVPKAKYIPNANAVLNSLGGRNINVDLALTSDEFGKRLESLPVNWSKMLCQKHEQKLIKFISKI